MTVTLISEASGSEGLALIPFAIMMIGLIVIVASMFVSPHQDTFFAIVCGGGSILAMGWFIGALGIFSTTPAEYEIAGTVSSIESVSASKDDGYTYSVFFEDETSSAVSLESPAAIKTESFNGKQAILSDCTQQDDDTYICGHVNLEKSLPAATHTLQEHG